MAGFVLRRSLSFRFRSPILAQREGEMLRSPKGQAGAEFLQPRMATHVMTGVPTVSHPELCSLIASGRARLFDVRTREEAAAGTIPGAVNIPVAELESALKMEPAVFRALYSAEKPKREDQNLIFFCQVGRRGHQATQLARSLGYTGARNYAGAYKEWVEKFR